MPPIGPLTRDELVIMDQAEAERKKVRRHRKMSNGMRVAIAKKEAANLYEGETNEVKAEVWKYIEDAKMHRDNEKEGMWSEDDYGR